MAFESDADEILYGGEPGGGKTSWLLGHAIMKHTRSHLFRRDAGQLGEMTDDLRALVGTVGRVTESPRPLWRNGDKRLEMAGIANEADAFKWHGRAGDFKGFDELPQFSKTQYLTVSGWGRSSVPGQKVQTAGTCNPPVDEDALWIVERWAAWLDPRHRNPAVSGEIRWFAMIGGEDTECEDGLPFEYNGETYYPASRTFIRARLSDNAYLGEDYRRKLDALPEPMRTIFKTSDFMALLQTSHPFQVIPTAWIRAAQQRWTPEIPELPGTQKRHPQSCVALDVAEGGKDRTVLAKRYGDWIAPLVWLPGSQTPRAEDSAAFVEPHLLEGGYVIVDADGVGGQAYGILKEKFKGRARAFRGVKPTLWRDRDWQGQGGQNEFFHCLTGDARVKPIGQVLRIYRARYDGPLYRVKMAGGDELTVTANHNVLTTRGWVAVHTLSVGDHLCDTGLGQRSEGRDPEEQHMPPPISEIYRAARARFGAQRVANSAVNFYGDRPVGEVEVVSINSALRWPVPTIGQHSENPDLVGHLLRQGALTGRGSRTLALGIGNLNPWTLNPRSRDASPDLPLDAMLLRSHAVRAQAVGNGIAAQGNVAPQERPRDRSFGHSKSTGKCFDRFTRAVTGFNSAAVERQSIPGWPILALSESHRFPLAAWVDAVFLEGAANDPRSGAVALAERVRRLAGQIPTDEIVGIEIFPNDHDGGSFVYTLETTSGAYSSQSIAHRNCKSAAYWCARMALDPTNPRKIALPPGADLLAELAAPRWYMAGQKIRVEKKEETIKRLGRSPDLAEAVIYALWNGSSVDIAESFEIKTGAA